MKGVLDLGGITNYEGLPKNIQLLFLLFDLSAKKGNLIESGKDEPPLKEFLANYIEVEPQTVSSYLQRFVKSNILKYRYTGQAFVNPSVYFSGTAQLRNDVISEYLKFKSNM